jgi:hypothetical protein
MVGQLPVAEERWVGISGCAMQRYKFLLSLFNLGTSFIFPSQAKQRIENCELICILSCHIKVANHLLQLTDKYLVVCTVSHVRCSTAR